MREEDVEGPVSACGDTSADGTRSCWENLVILSVSVRPRLVCTETYLGREDPAHWPEAEGEEDTRKEDHGDPGSLRGMVRGLIRWEGSDDGGQDRVSDDETPGTEHQRLLAPDSIEDEGDEAARSASVTENQFKNEETYKKFVIGPTAP